MEPRRRFQFATITFVLILCGLTAAPPPPQDGSRQQQPQPTFRAGVIVVPLDVRVVDRNGQPVPDLTAADFTIVEDGTRQEIAHFTRQMLAPEAPRAGLRARPGASPFDASPQAERVFLLVLGTAALGDPIRHPETLDALLRFTRERLLPQDQVALLAPAPPFMKDSRALVTDFSTDHEKIARLLEAMRTAGDGVATALRKQTTPVAVEAESVFQAPPSDFVPALQTEMGLEEYAKASPPPRGDLDMLFYGVRYLRFMSGEKHVIYVNGQFSGPFWPWEQMTRLIQLATDARVSIDTIQTGGWMGGQELPRSADPPPSAREQLAAPAETNGGPEVTVNPRRVEHAIAGLPGQAITEATGIGPRPVPGVRPMGSNPLRGMPGLYDLRHLAGMTGGQSSLLDVGDKSLARIDAATRVHYLLAYYPSNGNWNGRYRSIRVTVNRPDVTVLFRHGYTAQEKIEKFDRRAFLADSRLSAAGYSLADVRDIGLKVTPTFAKAATGRGGELLVKVVIDASRISFAINDLDRLEAHLDVAVYCGNANQDIVGRSRQTIDLNLTDATYERFMREGIPHEVRVPVTATPRFVKVVVLDFDANLTGSVMVKMK